MLLCINLSEGISIISAIGTILAALGSLFAAREARKTANISLKQLGEMREQRKDQVRPEMIISSTHFKSKYYPEIGYGTLYYKENIPELKISNVGYGHAKDIELDWEFNLKKYVEQIKKDSKVKNLIVVYSEGKILATSDNATTHLWNDYNQNIKVLLKDNDENIRIPFSYLQTLSILCHLNIINNIEYSELPTIKLKLIYKDIFGNINTKYYKVKPTYSVTNKSEELENDITNILDYKLDVEFNVNEVN